MMWMIMMMMNKVRDMTCIYNLSSKVMSKLYFQGPGGKERKKRPTLWVTIQVELTIDYGLFSMAMPKNGNIRPPSGCHIFSCVHLCIRSFIFFLLVS